jgi:hypothetical protein
MKIIIPSEGRADSITSHRFFPSALIAVSGENIAEYRAAGLPNLLETAGVTKAQKVNELCELNRNETLFFFDDDITAFSFFMQPVARLSWGKLIPTRKLLGLVEQCEACARDVGAYLFGFNHSANNIDCMESKPFQTVGFMSGHCFGLRPGHGLSMNTEIVGKNDFWLSALNLVKHRIIWQDRRLFVITRRIFSNRGGLSAQRNSVTEKKDLVLLKQAFGKLISVGKSKGGTRSATGEYAGMIRIRIESPFF